MEKKIQKIMLIMPSNTMPADSIRRIASPLGLLYMAAILKKEGYDVDILDSTLEGYWNTKTSEGYVTYGLTDEEIKKRIQESNPDVVGVSSMFSAHQKNALHHADLAKEVLPNIPIVLGGIHPSLDPIGSIKHHSIDYVILGEGEYRLLKLVNDLNENKTDFDFDGIVYKKEGEPVFKQMTNRIEELDPLPFPARELIDMEKYIKICVPYAPFPRKERVAQIMTSRGCNFNCVFCSTTNFWGSFRTRSVDNIIKEVDELVNKYGIQELQFSDDNMTIDKERAKELFRRLIPYKLSWCTPHGLMAQTLDDEMIDLMGQSGAYQITIAIESGNTRVREEIINKPVPSKEQIKRIIARCHKNGIQVHGLFVFGFPGETEAEMWDTFQYPYYVDFDSVSFFIANPVPGSRLYNQCKEKGYLPSEETRKIDFKASEINIPENDPNFVMPKEKLIELADSEKRRFNAWRKATDPKGFDLAYEQFLKRHGEQADLILGRVT